MHHVDAVGPPLGREAFDASLFGISPIKRPNKWHLLRAGTKTVR